MSSETHHIWLRATAVMCAALLVRGDAALQTQSQTAPVPATSDLLPSEQLDSLVAPIALYPDPLLAQVLAASTYPLELVQLQQWLSKNSKLKDKALADAVQKEKWDSSVQAMAGIPDLVKQLTDNIQWTSELGNAFLAQQSDVMLAVQRMRTKAKDSGKLTSSEQMKVETKIVESKQVVVIEQANPEVVYVPSYNPTVVWGAPAYAYPPVYYPPVGYYAAGMAISFGVGMAMGAFWGGGGWGNCGWGGNNNININTNNNFNRNSANVGNGNRSGNWQHNPQHRGGAPYGNRATADKFGGTVRGDSLGNRQANARQQLASDRNRGANRGAANDRNLGGNRAFEGDRNAGANRGAGNDRNVGANRGGNDRGGTGNRSASGADRIGNRQVSGGDRAKSSGAFDGSGRSNGSAARAQSSRGASSFSGSRGGGARGGGGRRR